MQASPPIVRQQPMIASTARFRGASIASS